MFTLKLICRVALYSLTLIPLYGCAGTTHVQLTRWHPVNFDVEGVNRLAVLTFGGKGEPAEQARSLVLEELNARGFYTLVDEGISRNLGAGAADLGEKAQLEQALVEARELRIDALLAAQLRGRLDTGGGVLGGAFRMGDPTVEVRLSYDLIHVPTGRILAQRSIVRSYDGELAETDGADISADKVAEQLVRVCAQDMVAEITARPESFEVALAAAAWRGEGSAEIGRGNQAAEEGKWREAMDHWHAVLEANPDSHAAMYNLGVAFEQAGDLEGAVQWYSKAIAEQDEEPYQNVLARLEAGREDYRLAQRQVWRPRNTALVSHHNRFPAAQRPRFEPLRQPGTHGGRVVSGEQAIAMPPERGGRF